MSSYKAFPHFVLRILWFASAWVAASTHLFGQR